MAKKLPKIEKNVPVPPLQIKRGINMEMLEEMKSGDSRWWPVEEAKKVMRFYRVAKKLDIKILIRKVGDEDPRGPGVRMWKAGEADDFIPQGEE